MFGSPKVRLLAVAAAGVISSGFAGHAVAQGQPGRAVIANAANQATTAEIDPVLWDLLEYWSKSSQEIRKLQGKHLRRVYDYTFEVEQDTEGNFYYEAPDKGRIDVHPIEITRQMVKDREEGKIPSKRGRAGQPFKLEKGQSERWICDGEKIFDIDDERKEATVVQLPPQLQGANIMNSPLPFLFGLPPKNAVERFSLSFSPGRDGSPQVFKRGDRYAHIRAEPKLQQDQANWSRADIILDVQTFLPAHVRL
ncbi:MAG: hypothetical protein R3C19_05275 [Planctomycetaceae bacterium]